MGSHGAEVQFPGEKRPRLMEAFASWQGRVRRFVREREDMRDLKLLRIRVEDKGPINAFHWRGAPDEEAAETWLAGVAQEAEAEGFDIHWGRKVLEIRPPVPVDKGQGIRAMVEAHAGPRRALRRRRRDRPGRLRRARRAHREGRSTTR